MGGLFGKEGGLARTDLRLREANYDEKGGMCAVDGDGGGPQECGRFMGVLFAIDGLLPSPAAASRPLPHPGQGIPLVDVSLLLADEKPAPASTFPPLPAALIRC